MSFRNWLSHPPTGVGIAVALMLLGAAALENEKYQAECRESGTGQNCDRTFEYMEHAGVPPIGAIKTPPRQPSPERQEWRSEQDLQAQWDMARWAFWAAFAALMSVGVTAVGVIFVKQTLEATRDAVKEAAKASDAGMIASQAAQTAAEASIAAERARFHIVIKNHDFYEIIAAATRWDKSPEMGYSNESFLTYCFRNYGKTPGIIEEVTHGIVVSAKPPDPVYSEVTDIIPEYMIGGESTTGDYNCIRRIVTTIGEAIPIAKGQSYIWFFGKLIYRDVFGNGQTHRFLFRFVRLSNDRWRMQPYDYKHYNKST